MSSFAATAGLMQAHVISKSVFSKRCAPQALLARNPLEHPGQKWGTQKALKSSVSPLLRAKSVFTGQKLQSQGNKQQPRRSLHQSWAGPNAELSTDGLLKTAKAITSTQLYSTWLQGGVVLFILAAIDAAYSGDWSRIGAITPETENALKPLLASLGFFHIFCAAVAAYSASSKGISVPKSVAKVLAVGGLALFEVLLKDPDSET